MTAVRIIFGVLALLVALFSGGCTVLLGYDFVMQRWQDGFASGAFEVLALGLVICGLSGAAAYALLRQPRGDGSGS